MQFQPAFGGLHHLARGQRSLQTLCLTCPCRAAQPPGLAPLAGSLVALHTGACGAVHALLSCSAKALSLAGLGPLPGHGGRLDVDAAVRLIETLVTLSNALYATLLRTYPTCDDQEAAADWDRWGRAAGREATWDEGHRAWMTRPIDGRMSSPFGGVECQ